MNLSNLHFDILVSLLHGPQYGYLIRKDIQGRHEGEYAPSFGTLYVALLKMINDGIVKESPSPPDNSDERRKYYELTTHGRTLIQNEIRSRQRINQKAEERLQKALGSDGWNVT